MIFELMEAIDVLVTALAVWIVAGVAMLMAVVAGGVWGARAAWRGLAGVRRRADGPEAAQGVHGTPGAPEAPQKESGYQEAA